MFSSALAFKAVAFFLTLYALDVYAPLLFERNPVTRLILKSGPGLFPAELALFAVMCIIYCRVRRAYLEACGRMVSREHKITPPAEELTNRPSKMNEGVKRPALSARKDRILRWSFSAAVTCVFLACLWDAANDAIVLLATYLHSIHG